MNPLIGALLGLNVAGGIGGMFMKDNTAEDMMQLAQRLFSPGALGASTNEFFKQFTNSPAFSAARAGTLGAANRLNLDVARNLGRTGMSQTGVGAVAGPLAGAAGSFKMGDLYAQAWMSAMQQAIDSARGIVGGASSLPQPRFTQPQLFGGGLDALSKALLYIITNQNMGAGNGVTGGVGGNPPMRRPV